MVRTLLGCPPSPTLHKDERLRIHRMDLSPEEEIPSCGVAGAALLHFGWGPVTAADVVHSYELTTGPGRTINSIEHLRAASAEALDDHTVIFRFETPRTDYAFQHAGRGSMVVYSTAQFDKEGVDLPRAMVESGVRMS